MISPAQVRIMMTNGCSGSSTLSISFEETGKSITQIALNYLQRPTVSSIIIGARNEEQLIQNIGAGGWALTSEQIARLDAASAQAPAYPVWHQLGMPELNERGSA